MVHSRSVRLATLFIYVIFGVASVRAFAQAPYEMLATPDQMIPMRDGVKLATDIYRPAKDGQPAQGKFPALLIRTPYDKTEGHQNYARYFVSHGYVLVIQNVRGRYKSEGHWRPAYDDGHDGFDTAQWIGHQTWSDGGVGAVGGSYEGATVHALAISDAPFLKAVMPEYSMSDIGQYGLRHHGAFELRWLNWVFSMGEPGDPPNLSAATRAASTPAAAPALADLVNHVSEYVQALPLRSGTTPLKYAPDYEQWLIGALSHPGGDPFFKDMGMDVVEHTAQYKDVPAYHVTGWYDSWSLQVANLNFVTLREHKQSLQKLIVGPWVHGSSSLSFSGDAQFTPDAAIDMAELERRWFDRWLKNLNNGIDHDAPVRIYVMGGGDAHKTPEGRIFVGGHWRDEQEWPLARAHTQAYYLHGDGELSPQAPTSHDPIRYQFDPHKPVPTLGGNISSEGDLMTRGATDQRCHKGVRLCTNDNPLSTRSNVVVFQTEPLESNIEVTGRLIVKLWAASDGPDTDFTAKLVDVYPPNADFPAGVDLNIGDGIVRARYRDSDTKPEFLQAGKPYEFTIEMYPTSILFKRGHRIRLDISSSNFPRFDVNPNTGEPLNANRSWRVAENSLYLDPGHPSRLLLPIIPAQ